MSDLTLSALMREQRFTMAETFRMVLLLAFTLEQMHAAGRTHGAVSSTHVTLNHEGMPLLRERTPLSSGDATVLAPEVRQGAPASEQSDVFGLAALMWQLVADEPSPVRLQSLLTAAVSEEVAQRPASMRQFREELQAVETLMGLPHTVLSPGVALEPGAALESWALDNTVHVANSQTAASVDDATHVRADRVAAVTAPIPVPLDAETVTRLRASAVPTVSEVKREASPRQVRPGAHETLPPHPLSYERGRVAFRPTGVSTTPEMYKPRATPKVAHVSRAAMPTDEAPAKRRMRRRGSHHTYRAYAARSVRRRVFNAVSLSAVVVVAAIAGLIMVI